MTTNQRTILWIAILASFIAFLDGSIVNVALPSITNELGGGLSLQQWVIDAYLITLGSLMLLAGSLSDIFGRKKILVLGLVGFGVTSLLCAAAQDGFFLTIARGLQGIAGALLVPSSLAFIIANFAGPLQSKAIGSWTAWTGMAFVAGPLVGGFLIDVSSWRTIFAINIIPIFFTLILLRKIKKPEQLKRKRLDITGAILCTFGLAGPVYALIEQPHYGWSSPFIYTPLLAGIILFVLFIWYEKRAKYPMLPLGLFSSRNFFAGNIATLFIYAALSLGTFLITIFVQQIGHYSALYAGLSLLPITLIMFFLSSRFGELSGRFGPRLFMTIGPIIAGIGFLLLLRVNESVDYLNQILPAVIIFGLGLSITVAPLTSAILSAIHPDQAGIASAVNNAVSRIAGLLSIAAISLITGSSLTLDGFHKGVGLMALLLILGGVISFVGIRNPKQVSQVQPS